MKDLHIHYGMDQRKAIEAAKLMGAKVIAVNGKGEYCYRFKSGKRVVTNGRRKDAPRKLVAALLSEQA